VDSIKFVSLLACCVQSIEVVDGGRWDCPIPTAFLDKSDTWGVKAHGVTHIQHKMAMRFLREHKRIVWLGHFRKGVEP
ncbi:MAG: hypothetical protein AAGJ35_16250, partial [Myxococcota bacterium]